MNNNVAKMRKSNMMTAANTYVEKIQGFAKDLELNFTNYEKSCVVNAVRTINQMIEANGYTWQNFDVDNTLTVLQQTAFLGLNPSALPRECYFIIRKSKDNNTGKWKPNIEFGVEGAGNDVILRKFGQDVKEVKSYIVYEGDEFKEGYMDGWDMTLPKYKRTFKTNKPEKAVYLIKKTNDEIDVQYADLEDVKKSLLANARQNLMNSKQKDKTDNILRELAKLNLYEILENEKWLDYKLDGSYGNYKTPLFNPSYTSPISMYNMIERKLRNHATRKYPKNFNTDTVSDLYENTFEEKYDDKGEAITPEEHVEIANNTFDDNAGSEEIEDNRPTIEEENFEPEQENEEISDSNDDVETEENEKQQEPKETNEKQEQQSNKNDSDDEWWK